MSTIVLAINRPKNSLIVIREGREVTVVSSDRQFRNSYEDVVGGLGLCGIGLDFEGNHVRINKSVSEDELAWLLSEDISWLVRMSH